MGTVFSYFVKQKKLELPNYAEILERIDVEIKEQVDLKKVYGNRHRTWLARILVTFCLIEIVLLLWYYFHEKPTDLAFHALHVAPLVVIPILGIYLKKLVSFYYNWRLESIEVYIKELRENQKEKVDELKKAFNFEEVFRLLNKYDPEAKALQMLRQRRDGGRVVNRPAPRTRPTQPPPQQKQIPVVVPPAATIPSQTPSLPPPQQTQKPQPSQQPKTSPVIPPQAGIMPEPTYIMPVPKVHNPNQFTVVQGAAIDKRGFFDQVVDFLVGDGPGSYSTVKCEFCGTMNGNLPKEEIETVQFTCYACGKFNDRGRSKKKEDKANTSSNNNNNTTTTTTTTTSSQEEGNMEEEEEEEVEGQEDQEQMEFKEEWEEVEGGYEEHEQHQQQQEDEPELEVEVDDDGEVEVDAVPSEEGLQSES